MDKSATEGVLAKPTEVIQRLIKASKSSNEELFADYQTSFDGYNLQKVNESLVKYGRNVFTHKKKTSIWLQIFGAFLSPFTVILLILAVISFATKDMPAVVVVVLMVSISGILKFVHDFRSGKAAEHLIAMVKTKIAVRRILADADTKELKAQTVEIPIDELVTGDIIHLAAGDMIPADVRILQEKDLFVSQSSLTGESEPTEKYSKPSTASYTNPLELENIAFMGSNVVSGSGLAIVIVTGDNTIFGTIAKQLQVKKPPTNFEKGVSAVSWVLIRFILVMVPFVMVINGFTKGNWMEAFLFAISVAVGLTPEMLPMIVSANLAKGAISMSKKKVIVKDLNSIQNFGAMDVLCTDKTGTITQDKIILQYHYDAMGNEDERVLRQAFLNSYYQTGLKNLLDVSIIEHAKDMKMMELYQDYHKVDEIPFDFNRRRMSVVVSDSAGKIQVITKGAIEEMLSISSFVEYSGTVRPLDDGLRKEILARCDKYNGNGLRVLGVAVKREDVHVGSFSVEDESDMVFIGYLAFLDPPKETSAAAIKALRHYSVEMKVLTGDNVAVTRYICKQVGLKSDNILSGSDIEKMSEDELRKAVEQTNIFAKLSPSQKARIVTALRANGHTVGFMGDGINDAPSMKVADVGISVDTAVDVAKESANIILLEKNLNVLVAGVIEGRKIYANIIKYIKMTASSNFGNMFSVLVASAFLPFLPMLPIQILALNLIYDTSCLAIPWDNVDADYLRKPRKWDASSITKFMLWIGPTSSIFDIATYILMFFLICPMVLGGAYSTLAPNAQAAFAAVFATGWFVESLWSQTFIINMIRTPKIPFIESRASWQLATLTTFGVVFGTVAPYNFIGRALGMKELPWYYFPFLAAIVLSYMMLVTVAKKLFIRRYGELL